MKLTDIRVESVAVAYSDERLSVPLLLSRGTIYACTYVKVTLQVRSRAGKLAQGLGAILLSDLWAFPAPELSHEDKDRIMRQLCASIATCLENDDYDDPVEKGFALERTLPDLMRRLAKNESLLHTTTLPLLAALNCLAPFDAALHDAWGALLGVPLYAGYTSQWLNRDLSAYLGPDFIGRYPGDYLAPRRQVLPVQHVVGITDALTPEQVKPDHPIPVGQPADLTSWIARDRVRYLKLKLHGQSPAEDASRIVEVYSSAISALAKAGITDGLHLSIDPNESYQDPAQLVDMLEQLASNAPQVLNVLDYIEQPTPRDLSSYSYTLHTVARRVPVIIDESLDTLEDLGRLQELGWSGMALKTCKGHTHSLLAYCWGRQHGLYLTLQDLTNPGLALVHSANFCSHLYLSTDCFECNQRQFLPTARPEEQNAFPGFFSVVEGSLFLPQTMGTGLY